MKTVLDYRMSRPDGWELRTGTFFPDVINGGERSGPYPKMIPTDNRMDLSDIVLCVEWGKNAFDGWFRFNMGWERPDQCLNPRAWIFPAMHYARGVALGPVGVEIKYEYGNTRYYLDTEIWLQDEADAVEWSQFSERHRWAR